MDHFNRRIKVLYVQEPAGGGSLIALLDLIRALDKDRIEPVVLCYQRNKYTSQFETVEGCKVIFADDHYDMHPKRQLRYSGKPFVNIVLIQYNSLKNYFKYDRKLVAYFRKIISTEKPDIIHHNNDISVNRPSIRAGSRLPQVLHYRGANSYRWKVVDYIIDSFLIRKICYHIYITESIQKHYRKMFRTPLSDSAVINDLVNKGIFKPAPASESLKKEFGIAGNEIIIANIGRITHWKGQHVLIEAINLIKDQLPRFKILMVGSYEKGVGSEDYFHHLQILSDKYQLAERIIFTGNRSDIAEIMNTSDVIVHTAVKPEPQGLVIIEAILCRKLMIASDAAGAAELIRKYGGILFQPGDAPQLARILLQLFSPVHSGEMPARYPDNHEKLLLDVNSSAKVKAMVEIYKRCTGINIKGGTAQKTGAGEIACGAASHKDIID